MQQITPILTTLTLVSHVVWVIGVIVFFLEPKVRSAVYRFVNTYVLQLILVVSLSAIAGSLTYSNIVGFAPCELCWIQRIFMYPQALLALLAWHWKDKSIISYLVPLSALGGIVALYHSLTHFGLGDGLVACTSALGDCGKLYVFEYGYITIPLMSLTVFVYLLTISAIYFKSRHVGQN